MQIGLDATLHASAELYIATGRCGLLLGLLHDALGDEAHPNLAGVEQAYSRQLVSWEALPQVEHSIQDIARGAVGKVVDPEGHFLPQLL